MQIVISLGKWPTNSPLLIETRKMEWKVRYRIGKYASGNGVVAAVRRFESKFQTLNESNVCSFQKKFEAELKKTSREKREPNKTIVRYSSTMGRPLFLGQLDSIVGTYLLAQSQRMCVINTCIANATAHALIKRNPKLSEILIWSLYLGLVVFSGKQYQWNAKKLHQKLKFPLHLERKFNFCFIKRHT